MLKWFFVFSPALSGPLRPRAGKIFSGPAAGNSGEKPGMGPERAGEGPEKVLREICVFCGFVAFCVRPDRYQCYVLFPAPAQHYIPIGFVFLSSFGLVSRIKSRAPRPSYIQVVPGCPGCVSRGVPGRAPWPCPGVSRGRVSRGMRFLHIWPFGASCPATFWSVFCWGLAFVLGAPWPTEARFPPGRRDMLPLAPDILGFWAFVLFILAFWAFIALPLA